jgi:hypothetical protein
MTTPTSTTAKVATRLAGARQLVQAVIIAGTSFIVVPFPPLYEDKWSSVARSQHQYKELAAASLWAPPSSRLSPHQERWLDR